MDSAWLIPTSLKKPDTSVCSVDVCGTYGVVTFSCVWLIHSTHTHTHASGPAPESGFTVPAPSGVPLLLLHSSLFY